MKTLILVLTLLIAGCYNGEVPVQSPSMLDSSPNGSKYDSVTFTLDSGISSGGNYFFNVYAKSLRSNFRLGNTTAIFEIDDNIKTFEVLDNYELINVNPKFKLGSGMGYQNPYIEYWTDSTGEDYAYAQIILEQDQPGSLLNQTDELLFTVKARINSTASFVVEWDAEHSVTWYPNRTIHPAWLGEVGVGF